MMPQRPVFSMLFQVSLLHNTGFLRLVAAARGLGDATATNFSQHLERLGTRHNRARFWDDVYEAEHR